MTKKVQIARKPVRLWDAEEGEGQKKPPTKRLTFDLDAALHLRMKLDCTRRGVDMSEEIRKILAERFPPNA